MISPGELECCSRRPAQFRRIPAPKARARMASKSPVRPEKYTPVTVVRMKDWLADEIKKVVQRDGLTTADIARRYPSIRRNDLCKILGDDHQVFGVSRLSAVAEAIGINSALGHCK